jgi:hypothetical protein
MDKMTAKIHVLHCGYIRIAKELLDNAGRFSTDIAKAMMTPDRNRITLPVSAYLIEHRTGIYLVDTGWSRDISLDGVYDYKAACKVLPRHLALLYHPYVPHGMTIREQLEATEEKILSPFASLTGHNDMLEDTAREKEAVDLENDRPKDFDEWYAMLMQMTEQQSL